MHRRLPPFDGCPCVRADARATARVKAAAHLGAQGNVWTEFIGTPAEVEYFTFRAAALAEVVWARTTGTSLISPAVLSTT